MGTQITEGTRNTRSTDGTRSTRSTEGARELTSSSKSLLTSAYGAVTFLVASFNGGDRRSSVGRHSLCISLTGPVHNTGVWREPTK